MSALWIENLRASNRRKKRKLPVLPLSLSANRRKRRKPPQVDPMGRGGYETSVDANDVVNDHEADRSWHGLTHPRSDPAWHNVQPDPAWRNVQPDLASDRLGAPPAWGNVGFQAEDGQTPLPGKKFDRFRWLVIFSQYSLAGALNDGAKLGALARLDRAAGHTLRYTEPLKVFVFGEGSSGELGLGATKKAIDVKRPRFNELLSNMNVVRRVSTRSPPTILARGNRRRWPPLPQHHVRRWQCPSTSSRTVLIIPFLGTPLFPDQRESLAASSGTACGRSHGQLGGQLGGPRLQTPRQHNPPVPSYENLEAEFDETIGVSAERRLERA
ncbi:hypothetical protein BDV95DRAFT_662423 [Massariosphaeria phaeospora]|uniref:Uncharacterized protein n=1 Tax=Massariosphaeria phaeospora TaxID=100035 RepID=A0A7C8IB80_9PLEO|nr:hypothetical protein BDV95DRAFT_662423 [Massariosphaeria phaeospora]